MSLSTGALGSLLPPAVAIPLCGAVAAPLLARWSRHAALIGCLGTMGGALAVLILLARARPGAATSASRRPASASSGRSTRTSGPTPTRCANYAAENQPNLSGTEPEKKEQADVRSRRAGT